MEKYPILYGRQCKMCMSKAELPEVQVSQGFTSATTHGYWMSVVAENMKGFSN